MHSNTGNLIAWSLDDTDVFKPLREMIEDGDTWVPDDSAFSNPMKGILISIPLGLAMWAVIILALSKLF